MSIFCYKTLTFYHFFVIFLYESEGFMSKNEKQILAVLKDKSELFEHIFEYPTKGKSGFFNLCCCDCGATYDAFISTEKDGKISISFGYDEEVTEKKRLKLRK
jgi:hypothetical protein